jgi:50S ribosomal subunit-associated GTPase HflX
MDTNVRDDVRRLCVTLYDVQNHELVGALGADVDDYVGLTLWLLAERAKGASSTWQAYLASLPERTSSPLLW